MSEHGLRPRPQRGELPGRYTGPTLANPCGNAGRENTTVAGADLLSFHPVTKRASRLPQAANRQRDSSSPGSPSHNPQQMLREHVARVAASQVRRIQTVRKRMQGAGGTDTDHDAFR